MKDEMPYLRFSTWRDGACWVENVVSEDGRNGAYLPTILEIPEISPDGEIVTFIDRFRFTVIWGASVEKIIIPDTVTDLADDAFSWFYNLTTVIIGSGVKSIGANFKMCPKLKEIYYNGTMSEWEAVGKDELWHGGASHVKYLQCLDGKIKLKR